MYIAGACNFVDKYCTRISAIVNRIKFTIGECIRRLSRIYAPGLSVRLFLRTGNYRFPGAQRNSVYSVHVRESTVGK